MLTEKNHTGLAAVARFWMGVALSGTSNWLILCNILLTSMGMVAALAGGGNVTWDGLFPVIVLTGATSLSLLAGCLLGIISSIVEVLYWRGDLDMHNASFWMRATIVSILGFDILSTVWALTNGIFFEPDNAIPSLVRVAMALAVTLFAFSVGAERWMVLGVQLIANNWEEALMTMKFIPRKKKDKGWQPKGENVHLPPTNGAPYPQPPQHQPSEAERREMQSYKDRMRAEAERRNQQAQQQHGKGKR